MKIGLVGLGVVGAPIAHKLYNFYKNDFVVLTDAAFEKDLRSVKEINCDKFSPVILVNGKDEKPMLDVLIIAVKNYDLISTSLLIDYFISDNTVLMPVENGIWASRYLRNKYPENIVAECYVRGPNTRHIENGFSYTKSGALHIGTSKENDIDTIMKVYELLKASGMDVHYEENIKNMIWRKWMLNVAGNTVTALTGASYRMFADSKDLQMICRQIMREFLLVANSEGVPLTWSDIDETIDYYCSFIGIFNFGFPQFKSFLVNEFVFSSEIDLRLFISCSIFFFFFEIVSKFSSEKRFLIFLLISSLNTSNPLFDGKFNTSFFRFSNSFFTFIN